jgi:hypothetical protein
MLKSARGTQVYGNTFVYPYRMSLKYFMYFSSQVSCWIYWFTQVYKVMNCTFHNVVSCEFLCLNTRYVPHFEQSSSGKVEFTPLNSHELLHIQKYYIILLFIELLFVPLRIFHSHFWLNELIGAILRTDVFSGEGSFTCQPTATWYLRIRITLILTSTCRGFTKAIPSFFFMFSVRGRIGFKAWTVKQNTFNKNLTYLFCV